MRKMYFVVCAILLGLSIGATQLLAWMNPSQQPPSGDVAVPINDTAFAQYKPGALNVGAVSVFGNFFLQNGTQAAGRVLVSDANGWARWASPSDFDDSISLTAGNGIVLSPPTITGAGMISADTSFLQQRVTGTCSSSQGIQSINADGSVTCVTIPPPAKCYANGSSYSSYYRCMVSREQCTVGSTRYTFLRCGTDGTWGLTSYCSISNDTTPNCNF